MRRPTARGLAGATLTVAMVAGLVLVPRILGDLPAVVPILSLPQVETFISRACGGSGAPCPGPSPERKPWDRPRWLGVLQRTLAERMPRVPEGERTRLANVIYDEARAASLDPLFVLAVIAVESGFDHGAESGAGARGLMQLTPSTLQSEAERSKLGGDLDDPALNVKAGIRYYRRLVQAFGSSDLALMAYNAGPNRILRYLEDGHIPERFLVYPRRIQQELTRFQRRHRPPAALARPAPAAPASPAPSGPASPSGAVPGAKPAAPPAPPALAEAEASAAPSPGSSGLSAP